jgi:hypothetical protein
MKSLGNVHNPLYPPYLKGDVVRRSLNFRRILKESSDFKSALVKN